MATTRKAVSAGRDGAAGVGSRNATSAGGRHGRMTKASRSGASKHVRRRDDGGPRTGWWLAACSAGLAVLAFRQAPGLIVPDTKLDLTADPAGFLGRALHLWEPAAAFGQLQNQAYGYLFPMGPFHLLADLASVPAWITQRAWWSLILVVAFLGMVRLAGALGVGTPWTRLLGGLVYALAPRILVSLGAVSIEAWPTAMAPWILLPLVRAWRGGSVIRNAALSALTVACVGGVNAAATAAAVVPAALWLLLAPSWTGRARFAVWWLVCVAAATVWWWGPLLLLGAYSPPFLDWIETAGNTTQHTSLIEVLRGSDHWLSYLNGPAGPQWPAGWLLASEPVLILDTVLVAALGLAGLARRDMPARRVLITAAVAGLVVVSSGYVGAAAGPWAEQVRGLLDGPLAPLRNVHKFDVLVRLPLALGVAHLLASARLGVVRGRRLRLAAAAQRRLRIVGAGLVVVALAGVATPALAGRLPQAGSYDELPGYWRDTAAWLDDNVGTGRALLIPGSAFGDYVWGSPRDEPLQALADTRWAVRDAAPLSSAGNIRLLDAIEARLAAGEGGAGVVQALDRAGVSHLVVRNDLHRARAEAPRPALVHQALADLPGVTRVATFGPEIGAADDPAVSADSRLDVRYPAVEIFELPAVSNPSRYSERSEYRDDNDEAEHRVRAYPLRGSLRVSGGPESLLTLGDAGVLDGQAVFVAGDGVDVADPAPTPVITDTLRRRAVWFGAIRDNATQVLEADDDGSLGRAARDFLPVDDPARETVAVVDGVADVAASSSGADPRATMARGAEHSPWAALDGDVGTSWVSGDYGQPVGQWLEVRFGQQRPVGSIELVTLDEAPVSAPIERVAVTTDAGTIATTVQPGAGSHVLPVAEGETDFLRIEVLAVGEGTPSGVGVRELRIRGVTVTRTLRAPALPAADLGGGAESAETLVFAVADGARGECVTVGETARCAPQAARTGEENAALRRQAEVAVGGQYDAVAAVRPRPGPELEALIDEAGGAVRAEASSRAVADPLGRPGAAVDLDPGTGWVAAADDDEPTLTLSWDEEQDVDGVRISAEASLAASRPSRVALDAGEGWHETDVAADGVALLPEPVETNELAVRILAVDEVTDTDVSFGLRSPLPAGVSELEILGDDDARAAVDEDAEVALECGAGPDLVVDGVTTPTEVPGTVGDLLRGGRLRAVPCGDQPLDLGPGRHDIALTSSPHTRPEALTLTPANVEPAASAEPSDVDVRAWEATRREVAVGAREEPVVLAVAENVNDGWTATLAGERLEPVRLDGWAQGFVVPPGRAGMIELTYGPDGPYRAALGAGVLGVAAVAVLAWRGVRRQPVRPRSSFGARHRRQAAGPTVAVAALALVAVGGFAGLAAAVVGVLIMLAGPRWPRLTKAAPGLAAAAVLLAGLVVALRPWPGPDAGAHSALAQVLVLVGLAVAIIGPIRWRAGRRPGREEQYVTLGDFFGPAEPEPSTEPERSGMPRQPTGYEPDESRRELS